MDLGRPSVPVLPRTDRCLDRWPQLAAWPLADWAPRVGVAGGARPAPLPARRAAGDPHRRHRPLGRGRWLCHRRARKSARLDHHAGAAFRLRRRRDRGRHPLRHARPGSRGERLSGRPGRCARGRRAGTDPWPGNGVAPGPEMAGRPRRRGLRGRAGRGAAHHRRHDANRLREFPDGRIARARQRCQLRLQDQLVGPRPDRSAWQRRF